MASLLTITNLCISFKNKLDIFKVVNDLNIEINAGETLAIVGESGSGKSVTALSLLHLLPNSCITTGKILFAQNNEENDILKIPLTKINELRGNKIAMIFQEPMTSLNPIMTCGNQIIETLIVHQKITYHAAFQKTIELFEKVKLPNAKDTLKKYPHELSGGQKQRVMIAMAICCNPALLIADEPTTALDVTIQKDILELLKELQNQHNMAILLITHDLGLVADMADKIVIMQKGNIIEKGVANDILKSPKEPYTKALLACRPAMNKKGNRLPMVSDFLNIKNENQIIRNDYSESSNEIVLKIENLKVYYPSKKSFFGKTMQYYKAVDDVSFDVKKGEILGLVGESGCGKTTLGKSILKLIPLTSGKIILNQKNISELNNKKFIEIRKNLQIVFQDPFGSLNPKLTIGDAILEAMEVHKLLHSKIQRKEYVMHLLEKVNLEKTHYNRYPHQFSGGQRQRICIARALALNPQFLIFDESVSALDVSVQAQVLNLLLDLKNEFNFSAIFISHDLSVVHYLCNRILVMQKGKIVEEGTANDIYFNPKNMYTQKLINAIPGKALLSN